MRYGVQITVACEYCGGPVTKITSEVNRAKRRGYGLFCNKTCGGLHRRSGKSHEEKTAEKAIYDKSYRAANDVLRQKKSDYAKRTYNPDKARVVRKQKAPQHLEYCRQPKYREYKKSYDMELRAAEYGDFAEAYKLLIELHREIIQRMPDKYERLKASGYFDPANIKERKRRNEQAKGSQCRWHTIRCISQAIPVGDIARR